MDEPVTFGMELMTDQLVLLTLEEARHLRRLLLAVGEEDGSKSAEADRWAREIAARAPFRELNITRRRTFAMPSGGQG